MSFFWRFLGLGALSFFALLGGLRWDLLNAQIQRQFPSVESISTAELAAALAQPGKAPILLDVRSQAEFEVSHLPGARWIDPEAKPEQIALKEKTLPIVTYCSVGYRSAAMAQRLQRAGFTNVRNLKGSIFQWANEGRSLVSHGKPVTQVHPYNAFWGSLLDSSRRAVVGPGK